jgi:hypothetical protein
MRLSWMKRRYFSKLSPAGDIALYNWTAQATAQDGHLCPRQWETLADVRLKQQIDGTTHKSILAHVDFINGVRSALLAAEALRVTSAPHTSPHSASQLTASRSNQASGLPP